MDNQEMIDKQYEDKRREMRQERDREMYNMLRDMSDYLNRYTVGFPLPWAVDATKQVEEFHDDKEAVQ
jgi:hypothetical protein